MSCSPIRAIDIYLPICMVSKMNIEPIAYIHTDFKEKFGIPRQSGRVKSLKGVIRFLPQYQNADAIRELDGFSHIWLIFDFSQSHREKWSPTVRPPRLGGNRKIGVFASRSPFRPNPLGLSCVKLEKIEHTKNGAVLIVSGVDLLDNTPIFDIKPYLPFADLIPNAVGGYADEKKDYSLSVECPQGMLDCFGDKKQTVIDCLKEDPRPSYQSDPDRVYKMNFDGYDVHFKVENQVATVVCVDKLPQK